MAHTALLKLGSKEYKVMECEYEFIQPIKDNGQPAGRPSGGLIHLTVVAPDNSDLFLHNWMQSATEHKEGQIVFAVVDTGTPSKKTVQFKRAYCIRLYEHFDGRNDGQMYAKITLSAAEIAFGETGSVVFKNDQK
jgi:hypothetical protein